MEQSEKNLRLRVEGMHCPHCQDRIEKKLRGLRGVSGVKVDYDKGRASLRYNPARVTVREIEAADRKSVV
jgi:copper chaperone CopZ